jgi:pyruvate-formate lyase-activating enzyme
MIAPEHIAPFRRALAALQAGQAEYRRLNALTTVDPTFIEPAQFVEDLMVAAFSDPVWTTRLVSVFFAWAETQPGTQSLLLIAAAINARERGDGPLAVRRSSRALALDSNNLHVQAVTRHESGVEVAPLKGRFCEAPFTGMETAPDGKVYFCCPAWLPTPIGKLTDDRGPDAVWNSPAAEEIRRSIHDGDYRYCSRVHCPKLSQDKLPATSKVTQRDLKTFAVARTTRIPRGPRRIVLSHDRSCNLSCPSCRTTTILARKDEQKRLNRIADEILLPLLGEADRVHVTGSGDPFGSNHFRYVLKRLNREDFPKLRLDIQTNGVLFDEGAWNDLDLEGRIDRVAVSIDAASEATYATVRRGGDFGRLMDNLAFLSTKRRDGSVKAMRLDCVVQAINFRELPAIIAIADRFGFDGVKLQMIRNWNTYSPAEFVANNIGSREHPDYAEFLDVLRQDVLNRKSIEFWGMPNAVADARKSSAIDDSTLQLTAWPVPT